MSIDRRGSESLSEQFGIQWSEAMERYVRTWLDFVFLRPQRFSRRYELRRDRYTRPVVFFVDSLLLCGLGLWAVQTVSSPSDDVANSIRPTIIAEGVRAFGQSIVVLLLCVLAVFLTFRRARVRPIFAALAYSSGFFVLLPFWNAVASSIAEGLEPYDDVATIVLALLFIIIQGCYLMFAVAAFHHIPRKYFLSAMAVLIAISLISQSLLPVTMNGSAVAKIMDTLDNPEAIIDNVTSRSSVILINTRSAAPHSEGWEEWDEVPQSAPRINVRILYWAPNRTLDDLRIILSPYEITRSTTGPNTIFMAELRASNAKVISRFALANDVAPNQLTLERVTLYPEGKKAAAAGPENESAPQITRRPGLLLGKLPKGQWGYVVATYRIQR